MDEWSGEDAVGHEGRVTHTRPIIDSYFMVQIVQSISISWSVSCMIAHVAGRTPYLLPGLAHAFFVINVRYRSPRPYHSSRIPSRWSRL